ncbi:MAG: RNA polymerase sigma-70 factor [Pedobacter sp.]|nr:MAG: RNA polymerase sigma-70 factor [Pedobacter sp.]
MLIKQVKILTDLDLLALIKKDDKKAFDIIYDRYWSKLYLSAYNILRNKEVVEDCLHEIFINLWIRRDIVEISNLNNYLLKSVRFQVFKSIRDGKSRVDLFEEIVDLNTLSNVEGLINEKEINGRLDMSIDKLPPKCKEIFILSRKMNLSGKEIAHKLGISEKTVENQITIALKKIRPSLGEFMFWFCVTNFYIFR